MQNLLAAVNIFAKTFIEYAWQDSIYVSVISVFFSNLHGTRKYWNLKGTLWKRFFPAIFLGKFTSGLGK